MPFGDPEELPALVFFEGGFVDREERGMDEDVVFDDVPAVFVGEEPLDGGLRSPSASEIFFGEKETGFEPFGVSLGLRFGQDSPNLLSLFGCFVWPIAEKVERPAKIRERLQGHLGLSWTLVADEEAGGHGFRPCLFRSGGLEGG